MKPIQPVPYPLFRALEEIGIARKTYSEEEKHPGLKPPISPEGKAHLNQFERLRKEDAVLPERSAEKIVYELTEKGKLFTKKHPHENSCEGGLMDINLGVINGGKERTLKEWNFLFDQANCLLEEIIKIPEKSYLNILVISQFGSNGK